MSIPLPSLARVTGEEAPLSHTQTAYMENTSTHDSV